MGPYVPETSDPSLVPSSDPTEQLEQGIESLDIKNTGEEKVERTEVEEKLGSSENAEGEEGNLPTKKIFLKDGGLALTGFSVGREYWVEVLQDPLHKYEFKLLED